MANQSARDTSSKAPSHRAYTVINYSTSDGEEKSRWNEIGSAWQHDDGKGFNITLHALPVDGRLTLRVNEPKEKD